jgi:hypothetical protein
MGNTRAAVGCDLPQGWTRVIFFCPLPPTAWVSIEKYINCINVLTLPSVLTVDFPLFIHAAFVNLFLTLVAIGRSEGKGKATERGQKAKGDGLLYAIAFSQPRRTVYRLTTCIIHQSTHAMPHMKTPFHTFCRSRGLPLKVVAAPVQSRHALKLCCKYIGTLKSAYTSICWCI